MQKKQTTEIQYGSNHHGGNGQSFFPLLSAAGYPKFLKLTIVLCTFTVHEKPPDRQKMTAKEVAERKMERKSKRVSAKPESNETQCGDGKTREGLEKSTSLPWSTAYED